MLWSCSWERNQMSAIWKMSNDSLKQSFASRIVHRLRVFFSVINTKLMTLVERYQNQHWWWKSIWCDSGGKSSDEIMLLKLHSLYVLVTLPSPLSLGSYSDRRPHDATCQRCHEYLGFNIVGNVWVTVSLHPNKIHNKGFIFRFRFLTF